jgi:cytoskeletal protein CcmA (bactofilin family)
MDKLEQGKSTETAPMSMIGSDIVVTGDIEASVDLQVEGRVIGDVRCATLILGERSYVGGNIYADRVRVSGNVEGSIEARDLAVEATAHVTGDVTYSRLRVINGGVLEGKITRRPVAENPNEASSLRLVNQVPEKSSKAVFIE